MKLSKKSQNPIDPSSIIVHNDKQIRSTNKNTTTLDLNSIPASRRQIRKESFSPNFTVDSNMNVESKVRIYSSIAHAPLLTNSNYRSNIRLLHKKLQKYEN